MIPASGRQATCPRTTICTLWGGASCMNWISETRAMRFKASSAPFARAMPAASAPTNTSGANVATGTFISARAERISEMRSTVKPISASAALSPRAIGLGHVPVQSSSCPFDAFSSREPVPTSLENAM